MRVAWRGKRCLGFDGENAMLVGQTQQTSLNDPYQQVFQQIARKSLESPYNTKVLLDEVSIPKGVTAVQFNPRRDNWRCWDRLVFVRTV